MNVAQKTCEMASIILFIRLHYICQNGGRWLLMKHNVHKNYTKKNNQLKSDDGNYDIWMYIILYSIVYYIV